MVKTWGLANHPRGVKTKSFIDHMVERYLSTGCLSVAHAFTNYFVASVGVTNDDSVTPITLGAPNSISIPSDTR